MLLNWAPYQGPFTRLLQLRPRVEYFAKNYNGRWKPVLSLEGECTWRGCILEVAALQFGVRYVSAKQHPNHEPYAPATSNSKVPRLLLPPTTHHPPIPHQPQPFAATATFARLSSDRHLVGCGGVFLDLAPLP
jgi:hypothetical protein